MKWNLNQRRTPVYLSFCIRVVKILEIHTLGLASKFQIFSRVTLENPQTFELSSTSKGPRKLSKILLRPQPQNFEGSKATLEKTSGVYKGPFFEEPQKTSIF